MGIRIPSREFIRRTGWTYFRIGSARWALVACRTHPESAKSLSGLAVRHGIRRAELAEITLRAQDVRCRQARIVAGIASRTKGAVRAVGLARDGAVCPVVAVVFLERRLRRGGKEYSCSQINQSTDCQDLAMLEYTSLKQDVHAA